MKSLKSCPFCGGTDISMGAFSISPDCYIVCNTCNAGIEKSVLWGDMDRKEHDEKCADILYGAWNRRV